MKQNQELFNGTVIGDSRVAVIMARVSKANTASLEAQENACRDFAKQKCIKVIRAVWLINDSSKEGKDYKEVLADIVNEKGVNTVLVYSFDRLSRIGTELSAIVDYLNTKGISVISATQPFELK